MAGKTIGKLASLLGQRAREPMSDSVPFRAKTLDIGSYVNRWVVRDHSKRKEFARNEVERQALRYIARNTSMTDRIRTFAQLRLSQMPSYTFQTQVKNRCIAGGRGRGILSDFRLSRIQFRHLALKGLIPGVKKASW